MDGYFQARKKLCSRACHEYRGKIGGNLSQIHTSDSDTGVADTGAQAGEDKIDSCSISFCFTFVEGPVLLH